jgi:hypothetical protein
MKYLSSFIAITFGLFLPLHGGLTVFLPELRFWKEALLGLVVVFVVLCEAKFFFQKPLNARSRLETYLKKFSKTDILAAGLLIWLFVLVLIDAEKIRAIQAVRYLGMLPFVYLVFSQLFKNIKKLNQVWHERKNIFVHYFCSYFLLSVLISVIFGVWIKFGNGSLFVQNFYSNTISSWVPGQTLPMWHEIDGVMRMQGLASGPVAFGHFCLLALGILPMWLTQKKCHPELDSGSSLSASTKQTVKIPDLVRHDRAWIFISVQIICSMFLLWAIWQSGSRAALLSAVLLIGWQLFQYVKIKNKKNVQSLLISGCVLFFVLGIGVLCKRPMIVRSVFDRAGTSDHFTRPVEAFQKFIASPFIGNLGQLGPAARAWNLKNTNNDKALIAENVYIDYLAQTGVIGFILFFLFFFSAIYGAFLQWRGILLVFALTMSMATLLDMTPLAISLGIILAMEMERKNSLK